MRSYKLFVRKTRLFEKNDEILSEIICTNYSFVRYKLKQTTNEDGPNYSSDCDSYM